MSDIKDEMEKMSASACKDVKGKWIYFTKEIHFTDDVRLSTKIELFMQPIKQFIHEKYPVILLGSPEFFLLTVFTAIMESGTHSKEEVNAAIQEIKKEYANSAKPLSNFNEKIFCPLNSMTKRIGALILLAGLMTLSIGLFEILRDNHYEITYAIQDWWGAVTHDHEYRRYPMAAWGVYLSIIGLLLSYLYDRGIGRIVRWVREGVSK